MINKWILAVLVIAACKSKVPVSRYNDFINDPENKIVQRIKIGAVEASMKWMPAEYHRQREKGFNKTDITMQESFYYFNAKFEKLEGEKPVKEKLMYLDFDMQKDFALLIGKDSIAPAICQKIENGIGGSYEYMLAFDSGGRKPEENDFTVIYNDKIFGIGSIAFVYNSGDIKRIPKLKEKTQDEVSYKPE